MEWEKELEESHRAQAAAKTAPSAQRARSSSSTSTSKRLELRTLEPMHRVEAATMVRELLASFPSLNLPDPKIYTTSMVEGLIEYPRWAGELTMKLIKRSYSFPPAVAEVVKTLEELVAPHRAAHRLSAPRLPPPEIDRSQRPTGEQLKAKYPELWEGRGQSSAADLVRARQQMVEQIGQEAWDRIPNAAPRMAGWRKLG